MHVIFSRHHKKKKINVLWLLSCAENNNNNKNCPVRKQRVGVPDSWIVFYLYIFRYLSKYIHNFWITPPFKIFTKIVGRENIKDSSVWQALGRQVFSDALGSGKCQESILLKIKMLIKLSSNCQEFLQIPTKYLLYNRINNCNYICICRGWQS